MKNIIISLLFAFAFLSLQGCAENTPATQAKAATHNEAGMGVGKCGTGMQGKCNTGKCGTSLKDKGMKCGTGKCGSAKAASGE